MKFSNLVGFSLLIASLALSGCSPVKPVMKRKVSEYTGEETIYFGPIHALGVPEIKGIMVISNYTI